MHDAKEPLTRASAFAAQQADLAQLSAAARRRGLIGIAGADFSSNDYLGLAGSSELAEAVGSALARGVAVGSGGSRLLRGNHPEHETLEAEAAAFFRCERTLYFSSGFAANSALFSTLPQRGDLVVHDELIHASAHEGMRLGRAETLAAPHNDANGFETAIRDWRRSGGTGRVWIAAESLYSMDGDRAPLAALAELADRHDAVLLIDEAHATGLFGPDGRGLAADLDGRGNVISLRTCGKALGCEGALICAPAVVCDFLINRGRGFIFSTAPSPLMAAAVRAALGILRDQPQRREALWQRVRAAERVLGPSGAAISGSQILPVIIGEDAATMAIAAALQSAGYDVRGIRPPTVPAGTSRLRVAITLNVSEAQIAGLGQALGQAALSPG
jgi:8-amino-7-oxononanoate synthase